VITVSYNSQDTISDTILSVRNQKYSNYEHILIDGLSTDATLSIARRHASEKLRIFSEKDRGIYDAMNKGFEIASGDIIVYLNSDDFYASDDILANVAAEFASKDVDVVYGDLDYVSRSNTSKVVRHWVSRKFSRIKLLFGWHPPHPAFFVRKEVLNKLGTFNLRYKIASDYDLMYRVLAMRKNRVAYLPATLVKMRSGGESGRNISQVIKANRECLLSGLAEGNPFFWMIPITKPLMKLRQVRIL
jgi:glycosyltransferase